MKNFQSRGQHSLLKGWDEHMNILIEIRCYKDHFDSSSYLFSVQKLAELRPNPSSLDLKFNNKYICFPDWSSVHFAVFKE